MKKYQKIGCVLVVCLLMAMLAFCAVAAEASLLTVRIAGDSCVITGCDSSASGELVIPETVYGKKVISVADGAFSGCSELESVILPDCIEEIGNRAFSDCKGLTRFSMPDSVRILGAGVFSGCSKLKTVKLSGSFTAVPKNTFYLCCALEEITLPDTINLLSERAFYGCNSLKSFVFPSEAEVVAAECFADCSALSEICLPSTVSDIGSSAFAGCSSLSIVYYTGDRATFDDITVSVGNNCLTSAYCVFSHSHNQADEIIKVDADCINSGYSQKIYSCGYKSELQIIPPKGHTLGNAVTVRKADCTNKGILRRYCCDCDYYLQEYTPLKGHTEVLDQAVKATCSKSGLTKGSHCSVCNSVIVKQSILPALGHDYSLKIKDSDHLAAKATYLSASRYYYSCSRCQKISSKTFKGEKLMLEGVKSIRFSSTESSISLEWNRVPSARGYALYIKNADGEYELYKRVRTNSIIIDGCPYGKVYYFYVKTYVVEKGNIVYSADHKSVKAATKPKAPAEITSKQNTSSVSLGWSKSKGATGYRVYRYDSKNKKWCIICDSTKLNEFVYENLRSAYRYKLAVRAFIDTGVERVWSARKSILTCTRPDSPEPKATSLKAAIRLEWDKVLRAEKYVVYVSENAGSGYEKVSTTALLSKKITGLESGKYYYFKVYAFRTVSDERVYSYTSRIVKAKTK